MIRAGISFGIRICLCSMCYSSRLAQMQALNISLSGQSTTISGLQERIAQIQKALASSEHDRRLLQEKLENVT